MLGFEKLVCIKPPNGKIDFMYCDLKYIDRGHLKVEFQINLTEPIHDAWLNVVSYHKDKTYQKFALEMWGNICDFLSGKSKSFALEWLIGTVQKYTNLNHSCPVAGVVTLKIKNISIDKFVLEPLIPVGRYRLDINVTEQRKDPILFQQVYFNVTEQPNGRRFG